MPTVTLAAVGGRSVTAVVTADGEYAGTVGPFAVASPWWAQAEEVTGHLDAALGVPTAILRILHAADVDEGKGGAITYHVEALRRPSVRLRRDRPPIDFGTDHPLRSDWARPDGLRELLAWVFSQVDGIPTQVKTWNLSCLYRVSTMDKTVWAKATARFAGHEPAAITAVRRHDPGLAPEVLERDDANRRMLVPHVPGEDCRSAPTAIVEQVVRRWVAAQAGIAGGPIDGVSARLPSELAGRVATLLDGQLGTRVELDAAWELHDKLPAIAEELAATGLPLTLVHGDLHPGNFRSDGTRHTIIDWADAYYGHPAADAFKLLDWLPEAQRPPVRAAWVDAWRRQLPDCDPQRALDLMAVISRVLDATLYQGFLDNIEPSERIYHEDDPAWEFLAALKAAS